MSVSLIDLAIPIGGPMNMAIIGISSAVALYFISLKALYGTYSIRQVMKDNEKKKFYSERYNQLFRSRDNCLYHIASARSRGDNDLALALVKDMQGIDEVISHTL